MEQKEMAKTRLIIYVLMAYGLTCLMGILMWYGSTKGYDLTVFPTDRKSTRLNSSHIEESRMPSSA